MISSALRPGMNAVRSSVFLLAIAAAALVSGCNDTTSLYSWTGTPDTVTIASASRVSLAGLGSGFDITTRTPVIIERLGAGQSYDFALTEQSGGFYLSPVGEFFGQSLRAGINTTTATDLTSVKSAPTDSASYAQTTPVQAKAGGVYIVRSRRVNCLYTTGSYYAKMRVISIDSAAGTMKFEMVQNPNCGDTSLQPPKG